MDSDSSSKFIESLTKFLQSLCNGYVEFQKGVELVGHIYLSIDTGEKVDYILHEKVSKNDENSVSFVSNSFHAHPPHRDKDKMSGKKDTSSKIGSSGRGPVDSSEDEDLMIVEQDRDTLGSTNTGTIPSRGLKRGALLSSDQRRVRGPLHSQGSSDFLSSSPRNRQQSGPAATMTRHDVPQDNINVVGMKLEQISSDELLTITSQVDDKASSSQDPHDVQSQQGPMHISRTPLNDAAGQPVWIKQEAPDDTHGGPDTGWSPSDSSNSGSNLYPVMMHQSPPVFPTNPVFPGFSPSSGPSSSQHRGLGHSLPGTSGATNPYANPLPGTSGNIASMDPAADHYGVKCEPNQGQPEYPTDQGLSLAGSCQVHHEQSLWYPGGRPRRQRLTKAEIDRRYMERIKKDPERYMRYKMKQKERSRRYEEKRRQKIQELRSKQ